MSMATIAELLAGTWRDPESGEPVSVPVKSVVVADSLKGAEADILGRLDLGRRFAVVCDPATEAVLGKRVERALSSLGRVDRIRLPERPHADEATAEQVRRASVGADVLVAVGSGTINDLCKYAGHRGGKPYVVFATAPSMNGYTSANAAITVHGHKKSLPATVPVGAFFDLGVLAGAPVRMIRGGLGDSLCRPTAQADWLLSHLLRGTPYRQAPFDLLLAEEAALFAESGALLQGDIVAMGRLVRTLILSGFGMSICGGSYPASQGEHLIGHYADMMGRDLPATFHGEAIGVATLTMARLQEWMLATPPRLEPTAVDEADMLDHFGPESGAACVKELKMKALDRGAAEALNARLATEWGDIERRISAVLPPVATLERALKDIGAPTNAAELGWPSAFYRRAVERARQIRGRYTFLDLAGDAGVLGGFAATS